MGTEWSARTAQLREIWSSRPDFAIFAGFSDRFSITVHTCHLRSRATSFDHFFTILYGCTASPVSFRTGVTSVRSPLAHGVVSRVYRARTHSGGPSVQRKDLPSCSRSSPLSRRIGIVASSGCSACPGQIAAAHPPLGRRPSHRASQCTRANRSCLSCTATYAFARHTCCELNRSEQILQVRAARTALCASTAAVQLYG